MAKPFRLRLLFDEQISTSVARALACLTKAVVHVGAEGQLPAGSSDADVAQSAKQQRRVLVTFNFDMVLAACDTGVRFIWFDQRGRSPTLLETAFIFLRQWEQWESGLSDASVKCLKVGRESIEVLSVEQARSRASRRFREAQQQRHRVLKHVRDRQQARLTFDDEGD